MIILLNLPTYMNGLLRMRDIFSEGGSGTIKFDMNTSTDHLWQYVAYTIKPPRTRPPPAHELRSYHSLIIIPLPAMSYITFL